MKIVIVGGGITGWLSAFLLGNRQPHHEYVIVESEDVKTIGVGEGTTGLFLHQVFNDHFGITLEEFFKETKATPKLGIEFNDWSEIGSSYFNPIDGSITRQESLDSSVFFNYIQESYLSKSSFNGIIRSKNKTPFYKKPGKLSYYDTALHLDNAATIAFFKKKTLELNNVSIINDTVSSVKRNEQGDVTDIVCNDNIVGGDLFIDCTGFARIFSEKEDWVSFKENLPMNSVTTFSKKHQGNIDLVTKSNAMSSGWCWEIPTQERYGCGYVHCDSFITQDDVEKEIKEVYPDAKINKTFKFDSGKLKQSWKNNVISLGLAYHFLEPLQATNIHLTLVQLDTLCIKYIRDSVDRTINKYCRDQYNNFVDNLIENFKHYINAHYSGRRTDTEFWKMISKGDHITDYTKEIIELTKNRGMFGSDFSSIFGGCGSQLWVYTILGMEHVDKEQCFKILAETGLYSRGVSKYFEVHEISEKLELLSYEELINRCNVDSKVEVLA